MKLDDLAHLDFDAVETTADWTRLLGELLGLADAAVAAKRRGVLADALDAYADRSSSPDLDAIARLDRSARKAARALRMTDVEEGIRELQAVSADVEALAGEIGVVSAGLRKEAAGLRAEHVVEAVSSLERTIASLQALADSATGLEDGSLATAIAETTDRATTLRRLLAEAGALPPQSR